ncbi:DUF6415 family natural product biosynthesis protein [Streptomyces sp. NBC_01267]|uniref:DUF6415 family natural product biosynthesis protein n=1 Tax=unclassified Streptomyces TaxID=2593676 RepID=UPI0022505735|nr:MULTISPECIES: DUF6415 family natural product biosynthesis protein [unclassified Streptomyces]MCX4550214.1 DUF6415 family natural product biosynthesis protein [Streptomyces sp. NBC_01500]WSV55668.1 DUF6415 family natural product biosynthesis protein [Streptomyces sp. NBC_01014]
MQKPTVLPAQPNRDPRPVDVETMRVITARLLGENAELPSLKELDTMCLQLRGHLMLLIPEVSELASQRPPEDELRATTAAGIGEARRRLSATQGYRLPVVLSYAQRLARSVDALCTHLENLEACGE